MHILFTGRSFNGLSVKKINVHAKVKVRMSKTENGVTENGIIETTPGKIIFNESIPQDLGFVDRSLPENKFKLEIDFLVNKKMLGKIIDKCYMKHGPTQTSVMLDKIKAKGYHYSTVSAITVSTSDMVVPEAKKKLLAEADAAVDKIEKMYRRGFISEDERYERIIDKWTKTTDKVADALMENLDRFNPIYMMADSGARGSKVR